jgi:RNA polymerase sigma-70 factor (ECF subfamily)
VAKIPVEVGNKTPKRASSTTAAGVVERLSSEQDRARFQNVVLPHLADAYALARWVTGDRTDAEDVVQEACLYAFRGIRGFAGINARAWLLTIVRRTAYMWLKENRSAALVMVDDLVAVEEKQAKQCAASGEVGTPEAALIAKADAVHLESAVAALPLPFRETLVLRDLQEARTGSLRRRPVPVFESHEYGKPRFSTAKVDVRSLRLINRCDPHGICVRLPLSADH